MKFVVVLDARGYVIVCKCMERELLDFDVARLLMNEMNDLGMTMLATLLVAVTLIVAQLYLFPV